MFFFDLVKNQVAQFGSLIKNVQKKFFQNLSFWRLFLEVKVRYCICKFLFKEKIFIFRGPFDFLKIKICRKRAAKLPIFWNWTYKSIPDRQQTVVPVFENALSLHLSVYALRRLSADSDWLPQPGAHYTPQVWFVGSSTPRGNSRLTQFISHHVF